MTDEAADQFERHALREQVRHKYHHRTPEQVERVVEAIETVLARELALAPEDSFVTSQPVTIIDPTLQ